MAAFQVATTALSIIGACQPERGRLGCRPGWQRPGCPTPLPAHWRDGRFFPQRAQSEHRHRGRARCSRPRAGLRVKIESAGGGGESPGPGLPPAQLRGGASGQFRRRGSLGRPKLPNFKGPPGPRRSASGFSHWPGPGTKPPRVRLRLGGTGTRARSGQVRSGQVRSGQVRSGQVRSGQVRSGQAPSIRVPFRMVLTAAMVTIMIRPSTSAE
jgi:hypothetical protein